MKDKSERVVVILFLIGIALRLRQYLNGRSLWVDEAMLALNIVNRDFGGLFNSLDYDQGAPVGFLLAEKLFNVFFGRHELVLRLFPLMAGFVSLWLFYLLLKQTTKKAGLLAALALFAVNPSIIYYSSEAKQYIVDVAVTLGLLVLAYPVFQGQARKRDYIHLGLAGIVALWFSHPALFVLAGIGIALVIQFLRNRDYSNIRLVLVVGILWLLNLGLLYFISLQNLSRNEYLANYWEDGFIPMPPWSNLDWFRVNSSENIQFQFGIQFMPWLVLVLILIGWFVLFRETQSFAITLAITTFVAFTASALHLYPVSGRLSLFLIPPGILLLGKAVELSQKIFTSNKIATVILTTALSGYLLYSPLTASLENFVAPKYHEHIRPTMQILSESWKDGDSIFVTAWAEPAFRFYAPFYGLEGIEIASSEIEDYPDGEKLKSRIDALIGQKRVWVLFSHVYENTGFNERDFLVAYLDEIGEQRREILKSGTSVYLFFYDLSN